MQPSTRLVLLRPPVYWQELDSLFKIVHLLFSKTKYAWLNHILMLWLFLYFLARILRSFVMNYGSPWATFSSQSTARWLLSLVPGNRRLQIPFKTDMVMIFFCIPLSAWHAMERINVHALFHYLQALGQISLRIWLSEKGHSGSNRARHDNWSNASILGCNNNAQPHVYM